MDLSCFTRFVFDEVFLLLIQSLKYLIEKGRVNLPYKLFVHRGLGLIHQLAEVVRDLSNLFLDYFVRVLFDPVEKLLHLLVDSFIHEAELIFISHSQVVGGA